MAELSLRQRFILKILVLALLHEWTLGRKPKEDMERLNLSLEDTVATIAVLLIEDFVMRSIKHRKGSLDIFLIISNPGCFREAKILTIKGEQAIKDSPLAELEKAWLKWQTA